MPPKPMGQWVIWVNTCYPVAMLVHDDCTRVLFINDKLAFHYTNNTVSDYFHLKTDILLKRQKVVRLLPHLSHRLLRPCMMIMVCIIKASAYDDKL